METVKITRRECLDKWNNTTCSGAYYLIHGRIYNGDGSRFYRFKFVLFFDFGVDLWDPETETDLEFCDVLENAIYAFIPDTELFGTPALSSFIDDCNSTIGAYNRRLARSWY